MFRNNYYEIQRARNQISNFSFLLNFYIGEYITLGCPGKLIENIDMENI